MDYVRRLVAVCYLDEAAIDIVQARRDPPNVGIGLRPAAARPQQVHAVAQQTQVATQQAQAAFQQGQQQAAAAAPVWILDAEQRRYRHWDEEMWVWQE